MYGSLTDTFFAILKASANQERPHSNCDLWTCKSTPLRYQCLFMLIKADGLRTKPRLKSYRIIPSLVTEIAHVSQ